MSIKDATMVSPESPKPVSSQRKPKSWPYNQLAYLTHLYVPDIYVYDDDPLKVRPQISENGVILKQGLEIFESSILSTETSVRLISADSHGTLA